MELKGSYYHPYILILQPHIRGELTHFIIKYRDFQKGEMDGACQDFR